MARREIYFVPLFLLISMAFINMAAIPPPEELTAGKYAEYDINFTVSNTVSLSATGTFRFDVEEKTSSLMKVLVTLSLQTPFTIQIKLRYKIDPNTGEVIDVETVEGEIKGIPRELRGRLSGSGLWISKDTSVGSTFNIGKTTATVIGSESVTAKNGVTYDCWKAELSTREGEKIYYYFDKSTGLLIKQTMSISAKYATVNFELILKDTNIVSPVFGILGLLGYISVGGMMIPVLLLIVAIAIIIVVIVVVIILKKRKAPTPPPPPPPT